MSIDQLYVSSPSFRLTRAKILGVKICRETELMKMFAESPEIDGTNAMNVLEKLSEPPLI